MIEFTLFVCILLVLSMLALTSINRKITHWERWDTNRADRWQTMRIWAITIQLVLWITLIMLFLNQGAK